MNDDELIALARRPSELTDAAQEILAGEIRLRKLRPPPTGQDDLQPAPRVSLDSVSEDDHYAEDRELVEIATLWSLSDALQLQRLLDAVHILFFMGLEKATRADAVTSNFGNGVSVQVMRIGLPWARLALQQYVPADGPAGEQCKYDEYADFAVHCPKCHATEVVFDELVNQPESATRTLAPKYKWTCDSCGHEWEDEGVQTEE